jgi:hypothetical protein
MIKFNSVTHDLLTVAKVFKKPFTAEQALRIMVTLKNPSKVKSSADILINHGFLKGFDDGTYLITGAGCSELFRLIAKKGQTGRKISLQK